eukprot:2108657-Prymnesium_polylepis.1
MMKELQSNRKRVLLDFQQFASQEIDKGPVWRFKVFRLFPIVSMLRKSDHWWRVFFPIAYAIAVVVMMNEVEWGQAHRDKLRLSPCWHDN